MRGKEGTSLHLVSRLVVEEEKQEENEEEVVVELVEMLGWCRHGSQSVTGRQDTLGRTGKHWETLGDTGRHYSLLTGTGGGTEGGGKYSLSCWAREGEGNSLIFLSADQPVSGH